MNRAATSISGVSGGTAVVRPLLTFAGVNTARSSESRPRRLVQLLLVVLLPVSALPLQAFIAPAATTDALPFTAPQPQWANPELSARARFYSTRPSGPHDPFHPTDPPPQPTLATQ